ncbi:MAG: hypothetical protein K8R69_02280 [Deltaproteobacteria bacterium]|nr:hypothetical protein [Deltaproteobacteria bacterium]
MGFAILAACTGVGPSGQAISPQEAGQGGASLSGPSVQGNAADKYEGGFPAPAADTENCPYNYCLLDFQIAAECRYEDGNRRLNFSGRIIPGLENKWKSLDGRRLRILDLEQDRFVDVILGGEVAPNEYNNLKNSSGAFRVFLNGKLPLKRELYVLPLGENSQSPVEKELPCEEGLCTPATSNLVTWEGSDLAPKHFSDSSKPFDKPTFLPSGEGMLPQASPTRMNPGRDLPLCKTGLD